MSPILTGRFLFTIPSGKSLKSSINPSRTSIFCATLEELGVTEKKMAKIFLRMQTSVSLAQLRRTPGSEFEKGKFGRLFFKSESTVVSLKYSTANISWDPSIVDSSDRHWKMNIMKCRSQSSPSGTEKALFSISPWPLNIKFSLYFYVLRDMVDRRFHPSLLSW